MIAAESHATRSTARAAPRQLDNVLAYFKGAIQPAPTSSFYVLGLLITAGVLILLVLMYIALIVAGGYAVYGRVVQDLSTFPSSERGIVVYAWHIVSSLLSVVIGLVLIALLLKPLLATPVRDGQPLALDRAQEPVVFSFVEKLCEVVGSPFPSRIEVNWEVSAAAYFRREWLSLFSRDYVLLIGMPLVAGMTTRQFAGVVAHELGHFRQSMGMRLYHLISLTNRWFARVVYERDSWDQRLFEQARAGGILAQFVRAVVWLTRRALWVFMVIGWAVSAFMTRQMELDADRIEAEVVGAECFAVRIRRFQTLKLAWTLAVRESQRAWQERKLVDNLPVFVAAKCSSIPKEGLAALDKELAEGCTGILSSHPCDRVRIERVQECPSPGIFHHEGPASDLFTNFRMVANAVSISFYREIVKLDVEQQNLQPVQEMVQNQEEVANQRRALSRYFQDCVTHARPLGLTDEALRPLDDVQKAIATLREARIRIQRAAPQFIPRYARRRELEGELLKLATASIHIRMEARMDPEFFGLRSAGSDGLREALEPVQRELGEIDQALAPWERVMRSRLHTGLRLLRAKEVTVRIGDWTRLADEVRRILPALERSEHLIHPWLTLRRNNMGLMHLLMMQDRDGIEDSVPRYRSTLLAVQQAVDAGIRDIRAQLESVYYPFDFGGCQVSMAHYALERLPGSDDPWEVSNAASEMLDQLEGFYVRSLGRLANIAEKVEGVAGFRPMMDPNAPAR